MVRASVRDSFPDQTAWEVVIGATDSIEQRANGGPLQFSLRRAAK
jgi:hypothetical protein